MSHVIAYLIIFGVIGFFIGHFWTRRKSVDLWMKDRERLESRVRNHDRDLDKARAELKSCRDQVGGLKAEAAASSQKLRAREEEFKALEAKLGSLNLLESELSTKEASMAALSTEINSLRSRLVKAEADLKKPAGPDPGLVTELNTIKQKLTAREAEIATLLNRVKELAPLGLQIKDRDLRLRDYEAKYSAALKDKEQAQAALDERLQELSSAQVLLSGKDDQIAKLTAQIVELEAQLQSGNGGPMDTSLIDGINRRDAGEVVE